MGGGFLKKVLVIGCPGSGKSTFSRRLAEITGLPLYHLDMIYHKPDKTTVSREEFDERLCEILSRDCWIIDGNYGRTMETRLSACDTVFFFDLPVDVCLAGVRERFGRPRPDMPWIETEENSEFMDFISAFPETKRPAILELLKKYPRETHTFTSRDDADAYLASLFLK